METRTSIGYATGAVIAFLALFALGLWASGCTTEVDAPIAHDVAGAPAAQPLTVLQTFRYINSNNGAQLNDTKLQRRAIRAYVMKLQGAPNRCICTSPTVGAFLEHNCGCATHGSYKLREAECVFESGVGLLCDIKRLDGGNWVHDVTVDIHLAPVDGFDVHYIRLNPDGSVHSSGDRFRGRWSPARLDWFRL